MCVHKTGRTKEKEQRERRERGRKECSYLLVHSQKVITAGAWLVLKLALGFPHGFLRKGTWPQVWTYQPTSFGDAAWKTAEDGSSTHLADMARAPGFCPPQSWMLHTFRDSSSGWMILSAFQINQLINQWNLKDKTPPCTRQCFSESAEELKRCT